MNQQLPRGIRNNNPGNIRLSKDKWQGLRQEQTDGTFFQFIAPPDFLNNTMTQAIVALKNADFNSEVIEAISRTNFTPIHMAIQGIFNNIFYGIILSIPVAALVCRKQTASPVSEEK